ncbi:hypothetical protein ABZ612_31400 [Streptomyces avermitilis]|uniref:hypothetical protein n=1 Tax=Streptomyces avermitilis TaxID=33903 RepID=UPI0033CB74A9
MVEVVAGAREQLVVTGSRSREKAYLFTGEDLAAISPYLTDHIMRFGTPGHPGTPSPVTVPLSLRTLCPVHPSDPEWRRSGVVPRVTVSSKGPLRLPKALK